MRCAIYIRVSSAEQRREGYSLPEQRRVLTEYAEKQGYKIVDVYADEGISASKKPHLRHDFQRMMRDVEAGLIDIIIFIKLDRWFRNVGDYYRTQEILDRHGVKWESVLEDYDTTTRTGRLNLNIKLTIAEDEAANTSERVKFVLDAKVRNKEPNTGTQPFGYKIEKIDGVKRIVKDPETEKETEDMFRMWFATRSAYQVTNYINNTYGRNLSDTTIARRLKNIAYTGEYKGISGYRPAYITHEQHAEILRSFQKHTRRSRQNKIYLFSGMVICPECGHVLASCTSNKTTLAYRCRYHMTRGCTYRHIVKEEDIENYLIENIGKHLKCYSFKIAAKNKKRSSVSPKKYEDQLERLNNVYIMGNISSEEYQQQSSALKAKIADLKAGKSQKAPIPQDVIKLLSDNKFPSLYNDLLREEKRALWRSCIDSISVNGTSPCSIRFIE